MTVLEKNASKFPKLFADIEFPENLSHAVWHTVTYADLFDYPVTLAEIHRYLIGFNASIESVEQVIQDEFLQNDSLETQDGFFFLPGKSHLIAIRKRRHQHAKQLWQQALRYGTWIAHIPFVRMVAVTGALASNNVEEDADLDYLIVTQPGYLWLCRAITLLLVKITAPFGARICPNYLITTRVLDLESSSFFSAQELSRMIPLVGMDIYYQFREANNWSERYLPNAGSAPYPEYQSKLRFKPLQVIGEFLLKGWLGQSLNRWEMKRKIAKLSQQGGNHPEVQFSEDHCKGHFEHHATQTMMAYTSKIETLSD